MPSLKKDCVWRGILWFYGLIRISKAGIWLFVRNIVGTLIDVGKGVLSPDSISLILDSKDRTKSSKTVSSSGLYLVGKDYPGKF